MKKPHRLFLIPVHRQATILIVCLFNFLLAFTQQGRHYSFYHFNSKNGMRSGLIRCLMPDSAGFLWIGTWNGLHRFDGAHFNVFSREAGEGKLLHSSVNDMCQTPDGIIWMGSETGIFRLSVPNQHFRYYNTMKLPVGPAIECITTERRNHIWAAGTSGLLQYIPQKDSFVLFKSGQSAADTFTSNRIRSNCLLKDPPGKGLWVATPKGLNFLNTGDLTVINHTKAGTTELWNDHQVRALAPAKNGNIWMFDNAEQTIKCFSPVTHQVNWTFETGKYFKTELGLTLFEDSQGNLWFSTAESGIWRIPIQRPEDLQQINHDPADQTSIAHESFWDAWEDINGTIYFGTLQGLSICNPSKPYYTYLKLPGAIVLQSDYFNTCGLFENPRDKSWWLTTHSGEAIRIDPATMQPEYYRMPGSDTIHEPQFLNVTFAGTDLIFSSTHGAWMQKNGNGRLRSLSEMLPDAYRHFLVKEALAANDSIIWLTDYLTLLRWNRKNGVIKEFKAPTGFEYVSGGAKIVRLRLSKQGKLWMAKVIGGFAWLNEKTGMIVPVPSNLPDYFFVKSSYLVDYALDTDGNPWFGMITQGIYAYKQALGRYVGMDERNGLNHNSYSTVQPDLLGNVWAFDYNQFSVIDTGQHVLYQSSLPVIGNPYKSTTLSLLLGNGDILLNQFGALVLIHPSSFIHQPKVPIPRISYCKTGDLERLVESDSMIVCQPNQNNIVIRFGLLINEDIFPYSLSYRLKGIDKEWQTAGSGKEVNYAILPPGTYEFLVQAVGKNGHWKSEIGKLVIRVKPHFYQTWWFLASCVFVLLSLVYLWYRDKLMRQQKWHSLERKADQLARGISLKEYENLKQHLNPHFLFNSLSALSSLIEINPSQAGQFLSALSKTYRYILQNKNKETVTIADEIAFVHTFLTLQQTRFGDQLQVDIKVSEENRYKEIVPVTLQNLLENAIKHNVINEEEALKVLIYDEDGYLVVRNEKNLKKFVDTSNRQGLESVKTLYSFLISKPVWYGTEGNDFVVKIPLI